MSAARALVRAWRAASPLAAPASVLHAARLHVMDALGVGLAGAGLEQGVPYRRYDAMAPQGRASSLASSRMLNAAEAALVNGGLIHSLEFDDTHTESIVHGSAVLAAAALAAGQEAGASGARILAAYMLGWEMLIRLGLAAKGAFQSRGFQITSVGGTLAAALVAADIAGASDDEMVNAMGIALSQSSGVFEFLTNGSSVKSLHPGWAAHAGLVAARLAACGITGPQTSIEGERGLFASFAGDRAAADAFVESLNDFGRVWRLEQAAFKLLPCCHYLHPFVEAALTLRGEGVAAKDIASLDLVIAARAAPIVCEPWATKLAPADGHSARWSLPIVVAEALVHGRVEHATFSRRADDDVLALARRASWRPLEPNNFPRAFEAEIHCAMVDGSTRSVRIDDVLGNAARPAGEEAVLAKFRANARLSLSEEGAAQAEAALLTLDKQDDMQQVGAALALRRAQEK